MVRRFSIPICVKPVEFCNPPRSASTGKGPWSVESGSRTGGSGASPPITGPSQLPGALMSESLSGTTVGPTGCLVQFWIFVL